MRFESVILNRVDMQHIRVVFFPTYWVDDIPNWLQTSFDPYKYDISLQFEPGPFERCFIIISFVV